MSTAIRVLLWGDVSGCFSTFEESVERAGDPIIHFDNNLTTADKYGAFDACICLGDFFGPIQYTDTDRDIRARLREILPRSLAIPTCWILDQPPSPQTFGAELRELLAMNELPSRLMFILMRTHASLPVHLATYVHTDMDAHVSACFAIWRIHSHS